jgi:3-dehydroquinate synthase
LKSSKIYEAHLHDKKFIHGKNRFVLPTRIGEVKIVEDVPQSIIREVLEEHIR